MSTLLSCSVPVVVCSVTTLIFYCWCCLLVWPWSYFCFCLCVMLVISVLFVCDACYFCFCLCVMLVISVFVCAWCLLLLFCPWPATKCVGSGEILVWSLVEHVRSAGGAKKQIRVEPLLCLQFPDTSVKYINMGYVTGKYGHLRQEESHLSCRTLFGDHRL